MKPWALLVICAALGCYSPSVRDCTVSCASPSDCAGGQVCTATGWCAAPDHTCANESPDAAPSDGPSPDGTQLCELGCTNGTCVAGVCVIDCSAPDTCPNEITCPANIPCRVTCGDRSCDRKVLCGLASPCEVVCSGMDACSDEIICGKDACSITCSGTNSCKRRLKCKESCACDASCTGAGSCTGDTTECPGGDACRLGKGCSSELDGCDRCM